MGSSDESSTSAVENYDDNEWPVLNTLRPRVCVTGSGTAPVTAASNTSLLYVTFNDSVLSPCRPAPRAALSPRQNILVERARTLPLNVPTSAIDHKSDKKTSRDQLPVKSNVRSNL